jgi:hypothetical protein
MKNKIIPKTLHQVIPPALPLSHIVPALEALQ